MPKVEISARAEEDLAMIWGFIAADNLAAANRTLRRIDTACSSYAHQPELGEFRPELGSDILCFTVGLYVIYYHPCGTGIEVARVLHGARDVGRNF